MSSNIIKPELLDKELLTELFDIPSSFSFDSDIVLSKNFTYVKITECARDNYFEEPLISRSTILKIITTKRGLTNKELTNAVKEQSAKDTMAVLHGLLKKNSHSLNKLKEEDSITIVIPVLSTKRNDDGDLFCLELIGNSLGWSLEDSHIHRERYIGIGVAILIK